MIDGLDGRQHCTEVAREKSDAALALGTTQDWRDILYERREAWSMPRIKIEREAVYKHQGAGQFTISQSSLTRGYDGSETS